MRYNALGETNIKVSEICLGSMTWGTQNSYAEARAQIDLAIECGVNLSTLPSCTRQLPYPLKHMGKQRS